MWGPNKQKANSAVSNRKIFRHTSAVLIYNSTISGQQNLRKTTGTPPRIAFLLSKTAFELHKKKNCMEIMGTKSLEFTSSNVVVYQTKYKSGHGLDWLSPQWTGHSEQDTLMWGQLSITTLNRTHSCVDSWVSPQWTGHTHVWTADFGSAELCAWHLWERSARKRCRGCDVKTWTLIDKTEMQRLWNEAKTWTLMVKVKK